MGFLSVWLFRPIFLFDYLFSWNFLSSLVTEVVAARNYYLMGAESTKDKTDNVEV